MDPEGAGNLSKLRQQAQSNLAQSTQERLLLEYHVRLRHFRQNYYTGGASLVHTYKLCGEKPCSTCGPAYNPGQPGTTTV